MPLGNFWNFLSSSRQKRPGGAANSASSDAGFDDGNASDANQFQTSGATDLTSSAFADPSAFFNAIASAPEWSASDAAMPSASVTATASDASAAPIDAGASWLGSIQSIVNQAVLNSSFSLSSTTGTGASSALQADTLRNTFGVDGTGIKIGVISDSYNVLGGAASDIALGNLPASGVQVLQEGPAGSTDEGRAMLDLVHQIAPGASLAFYSGSTSEAGFAAGINALVNAGCNIIVDDLTYLDEPFFQDGIVAQAVNNAAANGVAYFTAAGNEASNAYEAAFSPIATAVTLPDGTRVTNAQNFGGGTYMQSITMGAGTAFILQWDQAWGQATSDIDVRVYQGSTLLGDVTRFNSGEPNNPFVGFINNSSTTQTFQIAITNDSGPNPDLIKYILFGDGAPDSINNFATNSGTLIGHEEATGAVAVAAADYLTPTQVESYSSTGPGQILFSDSGGPLISPITTSIGLTGVDGLSTSVFSPFFGTSAAAPTAAAVAALLEQAAPGDSASTVEAALENTATDIGAPGVDNSSGHGLVDGIAAGDSIATPHDYVANSSGDKIYPGTGNNTITGGAGNDTIYITKDSNNTIDGGGGTNTVDYSTSPAAIDVNLGTGVASNGFGGIDTLTNIQIVRGSTFGGILTGDSGNDTFVIEGGSNAVDGGGGINIVDYSAARGALNIDLATGTASNGFGGADTLNQIQDVIGSSFNDTFIGNSSDNIFTDNGGSDTITGGGGIDTAILPGSATSYSVSLVGAGSYQLSSSSGTDALNGITFVSFAGGLNGSVPSNSGPSSVGVGDIFGDGSKEWIFRAANGQLGYWEMNGFSVDAIGQIGPVMSSYWQVAGLADFNGDGKTDVLWRGQDGELQIWELNGGAVQTVVNLPSVPSYWQVAGLADFNGDGKTDILWRGAGGEVGMWLMNGDQVGATPVVPSVPSYWQIAGLADFNGDGNTDILWRGANGEVGMWLMDGSTIEATPVVPSAPTNWQIAGLADFNGDGKADILWRSQSGQVGMWEMNGPSIQATPVVPGAPTSWQIAAVADVNGDGKADILWMGPNNVPGLWEMNGPSLAATGVPADSLPSNWMFTTESIAQLVSNSSGSSSSELAILPQYAPASSQITATIQGTSGNDTLAASAGANETLVGNGGNDTYQIGSGIGQDTIVNGLASNAGPTGTLAFGSGIADNQLWLKQSGNDLVVELMGSQSQVTVAGWFSGATSQVQEITTADGMKLDNQVSQLVQAMATYSSANPSFDPTATATAPNDPTLQNAIAAAWHH